MSPKYQSQVPRQKWTTSTFHVTSPPRCSKEVIFIIQLLYSVSSKVYSILRVLFPSPSPFHRHPKRVMLCTSFIHRPLPLLLPLRVTTVPATSILLLLLTVLTPVLSLTLSLVSTTVRVSSSSSTSSETLRTPESLSLTSDLLTLGRYGCTYTSTTLGSSRLESFIGSGRLLTSGGLLTDTEEVVCVLVLVGLSRWLGITESTSDTGGSV